MDTLLAHHALYPTWPHNLGFLTAQYTTHPYYKDEKDSWKEGGNINQYWEYNVKDACITWEVARRLSAELLHRKVDKIFYTHIMKLQQYLIAATVLGNRIDLDMRLKLEDEYSKEVASASQLFLEQARIAIDDPLYEVNPLSPKQLSLLMFNRLRLVGKSVSTDESNRDSIIANPRTPDAAKQMLITLNRFKEKHKLYSTYITAKVDEDGRMRSDYKQFGTQFVPGRLSSSSTLWDSGMNLQNQPEMLRGMFIADPKYVYVYFDGAQAEARIVAYEANIVKWKEQFERARLNPGSYDAHIALASEMFGVPYDSVPKFDYYDQTNATPEHPIGSLSLRAISKRCRHGLNYRMQASRLAETTGLPLSISTDSYHAYHRTTPELMKWWEEVIHEVRTNRVLWTCKGRAMPFFGSTLDESLLDSIIAFKPQSTLGDHVTEVQWKSQEDSNWPVSARIPFNNHDSLTAMCHIHDVERVALIMKKHMEEPLVIRGDSLIIPSDFKVCYPDEKGLHRWSNMKKLKLA
jgi:DNA polymerase I-like protein with 3'-5' exonuclease and polymerase domains